MWVDTGCGVVGNVVQMSGVVFEVFICMLYIDKTFFSQSAVVMLFNRCLTPGVLSQYNTITYTLWYLYGMTEPANMMFL